MFPEASRSNAARCGEDKRRECGWLRDVRKRPVDDGGDGVWRGDQSERRGGAAVGEQGGVAKQREVVADQAGVDAGEDAAAQNGDGGAAVELGVMSGDVGGWGEGFGEEVALPGGGGEQESAEAGVGGDGFGLGAAIARKR